MNVLKAIKQRKSIRQFSKKPIEKEKLNTIIKYANYAPSAGNLKARIIIVYNSEEIKEKLCNASYGQKFVAQAPIVLVFCADMALSSKKYGDRGELYAIQDATIACAYAQLIAEEFGLSSCWVGAFAEWEVQEVVGYHMKPVALLPIGYKVN